MTYLTYIRVSVIEVLVPLATTVPVPAEVMVAGQRPPPPVFGMVLVSSITVLVTLPLLINHKNHKDPV